MEKCSLGPIEPGADASASSRLGVVGLQAKTKSMPDAPIQDACRLVQGGHSVLFCGDAETRLLVSGV